MPLALADVRHSITNFAPSCACGLDGRTPAVLKALPDGIFDFILVRHDRVGETVTWPRIIGWPGIDSIHKAEYCEPLIFRRVSVTAAFCRIWAAAHMRQLSAAHSKRHGCIEGGMDALVKLTLAFEESVLDGDTLLSVTADRSEAFNNVRVA